MKKRLIISSVILGVLVLSVAGFWAYKSGKLAGLADVITSGKKGAIVIVKNNLGNPVEGAYVQICWHKNGEYEWICSGYLLTTTKEGKVFHYSDDTDPRWPTQPDTWGFRYQVRLNGYCSSPEQVLLPYYDFINRLNEMNFTLIQSANCNTNQGNALIEGFVYDKDKTDRPPIEGAKISIRGVSNSGQSVALTKETNKDGNFKIFNVPQGVAYDLICSKEGFGTYKARINVIADEEYFYNIGLEAPPPPKDKFTLIGKLSKASNPNEIIADATIRVSWTIGGVTSWISPDGKSTTDQQYNIVIKDIPLKPENASYYVYYVLISHPEFEVMEQDIGFRIDELQYAKEWNAWVWGKKNFILNRRPFFSVFGTVKEKMPIPNMPVKDADVIVELYKDNQPQRSYSAKTDKRGNYLINDVAFNPYLQYYFRVEHSSYKKIRQGPQQFTTLPLMQNPDRAALEKNFMLNPGGIDCKKILKDFCPSCQR